MVVHIVMGVSVRALVRAVVMVLGMLGNLESLRSRPRECGERWTEWKVESQWRHSWLATAGLQI